MSVLYVALAGFLALAIVCELFVLVWRLVRKLARELNPWRVRPTNRGERRAAARRNARRR